MATNPAPVVRVGVAAIIKDDDGRMVMGVRKGSHGSGTWQFPGGHLDVGESWFECAERETLEETGLQVKAEKFVALTNDVFDPEKKHYITIFIVCKRVDDTQEPVIMEPEKCESWSWKTWSDVRSMMSAAAAEGKEEEKEKGQQKFFLPIVNLLRDHPDIESLI
ncbi:NUDIX hydrolase domain-like protein [Podospora australis]|uniref:NUDIX hydrolase domain-like protein n=1 Tax=Podospora australis TaxID=1536484 RepID=A0AAN6WNN2_9PEZI|nr:NUDIX hydrolase domain-like protein [Podospora australis]